MIDLSQKSGILFGVLLLILQVSLRLERLGIDNIFVILKSLAYLDVKNIKGGLYIPQKCLKDNNITQKGFIRDWYSQANVENVANCSILCYLVSLGLLEENGDPWKPRFLTTTTPRKFSCKVTEKEDRCIKAFEYSECIFKKKGLVRNY